MLSPFVLASAGVTAGVLFVLFTLSRSVRYVRNNRLAESYTTKVAIPRQPKGH